MKAKTILITIVVILGLTSLACGITLTMPEDAIEIGDISTENIFVSAPDQGQTTSVLIEFGAGKLILQPGAEDGLVVGTATYNVEGLEPKVTSGGGEVSIKQDTYEFKLGGLPNVQDVENTWELFISDAPIDLEIRAGAFEGELELGSMAIEALRVFSGASSVDINFSTPNLTTMNQLHYTTGASKAELFGLANANFSLMKFEVGAGDYTLDFSGSLLRDATVEIDGALSNVKIIVPEGIPTTLKIDGSLTNVNARGQWAGGASTYSLAGNGPTLTFQVKLGAGNLELSN
jgi:hypothetical protein